VHEISESLIGLAHVFVAADVQTTYALAGLLEERLSVYGGAVRLYWPDLGAGGAPRMHPLWMADRVREFDATDRHFAGHVFRILAPVAAMRTPVSEVEQRLRQAEDARLAGDLAQLQADAGNIPAEWQKYVEEVFDQNRNLRESNEELGREVEALRANWATLNQSAKPEPEEDGVLVPAQPISSMADAVLRAADDCVNLHFHEQAFSSADESPFMRPQEVYDALLRFDGILGEEATAGLGKSREARCKEEGLDYAADISGTSEGKHHAQYRIRLEGVEYVLRQHLRFGKGNPAECARVYFFRSEAGEWWVGHFGKHLRVTTS
jgi:hypothetical protein